MKQYIVYIFIIIAAAGCCPETFSSHTDDVTVKLHFETGTPPYYQGISEGNMKTKSADPQEHLITDINLFIFNDRGVLEDRIYLTSKQMNDTGNGYSTNTELLRNATYTIYACANTGYRMDISSLDELLSYRYYLTYPDDYRTGIPMSGTSGQVTITDSRPIAIPLERTMAKISVSIDRSRLDKDVGFFIRSIRIEGCPKSVKFFGSSSAISENDIFITGFHKSDEDAAPLNHDTGWDRSGSVDMYMLENRHGDLLPDTGTEEDKVLDSSHPLARLCSYIEIKAEYLSEEHFSNPGEYLIYRFYIGEGSGNFDVTRNTHYHITVMPQGDGLSGNSWRIDKSEIGSYIREIKLSYDSIDMTYMGESVQVTAFTRPEDISPGLIGWDSSDESVARVSQDGRITASGEGECTITCYATDGSDVYAECMVNVEFSPVYMKVYPGNFIRGKTGETYKIRCEYFPPSAKFDIGLEELEYDKGRGIYDYTVDNDGKGVTLKLKNKGSGLLFFEAGYPVNQSELIVISVD